jgi:UDP-N-acetyl-D-glucosamine/UDP-N-acetyl-D-galactosamine dehydrogenase
MTQSHKSLDKQYSIAIVGLGYVGLPLAVEFGKKMTTLGLDLSAEKVAAYRTHIDPTGEISTQELKAANQLKCHTNPSVLEKADFIIITVPTPVDVAHQPDLTALIKSCETVGEHLKRGDIVVYESTVYPGATEEVCIPILEKQSGLKWKQDFWVGYSPERINPGDLEHTITKIVKVVSADTPATLDKVSEVYSRIITAGVFKASSIKVAEAAKVIENTQRDLNIALMNELAIIFELVGIDMLEVLKVAGTKWNFLPFRPGLVGGHCIGVDPYYLTYKAKKLGYTPKVILAGRSTNDGMAAHIAQQTIKQMIGIGINIKGSKVIVLGLTFKENCSDLRNSKVADLVKELQEFGCEMHVHDPLADHDQALHEYGITLKEWDELPQNADTIVAAVSHMEYTTQSVASLLSPLKPGGMFIDIKSAYLPEAITSTGASLWRL